MSPFTRIIFVFCPPMFPCVNQSTGRFTMNNLKPHSGLLSSSEAAKRLGLSLGHLQNMRSRGKGPDFIQLGRAVRYRPQDIEAYIDTKRVNLK
jgi:predicted DNA-binding transcriptional regulator AlpA